MEGTGFLTMMPEPPALPFPGPEGPWLDRGRPARLRRRVRHSGFFGPVSYYRNLDANFDVIKDLGPERVTMPSVLHRRHRRPRHVMDPIGHRADAELLPDFRGGTLIDGAGHWTQQEAPAAFNEALLGFLADVVDLARRRRSDANLAAVELAEQAEHLQVQPHERDHEAEGGEPLHALGQTCLGARSMKSKSSARFIAARPAAKTLKPMPNRLVELRKLTAPPPVNRRITNDTR